ncbi:hypothetical protein jhhlp_007678 [Lomentospora prolificans]|uniref:PXA domain-containing protein n=1 Tax=Lomentospora prolificans TaxID=41688 RepID=A0A2N3N094_9PEZI|nr:hypothetical protein jhhlp_007678 [Lomentospora prolificans]
MEINFPPLSEMEPKDVPAPIASRKISGVDGDTDATGTLSTEPPPPVIDSTRTNANTSQEVSAKVLEFLGTATPGTFSALALVLSLLIYLTLGRIGLILIGACGGVILYIALEASHPEITRAIRGEKGIDVIQRLVGQTREADERTNGKAPEDSDDTALRSFDDFRPETREALKSLVDAVLRDYVKWWYNPIVPSDRSFPLACRKLLSSFILSAANHLSHKRPSDAFLDFLTNSSSMIIVFCSELSAAFAELPPDSKVTSVDAVYNYLASNPDSNLANLLNQRQQASKFRMVAEDLLGFLDKTAHDCEVVRAFLREMLSGVVLESILWTCSKPEWINGWIVYLLEAGEPDFNQAIDVGMQTGRDSNTAVFADIDNNTGAVTLVKSGTFEPTNGGRKENINCHRKQLSKAEEDMEEAMEEMKRMNELLAAENARHAAYLTGPSDDVENLDNPVDPLLHDIIGHNMAPISSGNASPRSPLSPDKASMKATSADDYSNKGEGCHTPATPQSMTADSIQNNRSPKRNSKFQFTSFDQIVPPAQERSDENDEGHRVSFTLQNATITIHDDSSYEKGRVRSRPTWDYLIQVEPSSSQFSGWMIVRKYADFETLHEVLRRIATISGATSFSEQHSDLPAWKMHTRSSLRGELERYIRDACWYQSLAESEGMRRFLDKDQGLPNNTDNRASFGLDTFGKNVLDVLTTAPKGAMQGGKTIVGGVTGVLGNIGLGQRKATQSSLKDLPANGANRLSISTPPRVNSMPSPVHSQKARDSMDSQRSSVISTQPAKIAPMERRASSQFDPEGDTNESRRSPYERTESARGSNNNSRSSSRAPLRSPSSTSLDGIRLPPLPGEIDDYEPRPLQHKRSKTTDNTMAPNTSALPSLPISPPAAVSSLKKSPTAGSKGSKQFAPLSEQEASVAVELMFAVINELYTLSSAWNIRRTLLGAAKSFLLRPGNPSLVSIRSLIQQAVIDANTSDAGIATHLRKLRENSLPTEGEKATWPAEMTQAEKDSLRDKARKLLIQSGVPAALTGVMGQSATNEAVGRIFDCLQIEEVARGLMFGILLQAVRIVTH